VQAQNITHKTKKYFTKIGSVHKPEVCPTKGTPTTLAIFGNNQHADLRPACWLLLLAF